MRFIKKLFIYILIIAIVFGLASCTKYFYECATYSETFEYQLTELSDGVYGYYNAVASNIPSENYEMIVLCLNGSVYTLKGDVNIHYTDNVCKLIWHDVKTVNGDTYEVYVPPCSIEMRPNLVQS